MSIRQRKGEGVSKQDLLNEDEQDQLIKDFQKQDQLYNNIYIILGFVFSWSACYYFSSSSDYVSIISTLIAPGYLFVDKRASLFGIILGMYPLLGKFEIANSIPLVVNMYIVMVSFDIASAQEKIKALDKSRYKLKAV
ncbi:hypothetical protein HK103_007685 [Boothiomyces macroporosus]|uniref:Uncharacterized protein n=1 Tax=Boothiomyces macroporosus TaxID=261099 RepID=A0AAD5Y5Q3_9FUNG|nr:hypothetical protein HK103_007685 [Boothiomyces macroporosus]